MTWISPKEQLPPQGKKILAFYNGDYWVVQRIGPYWAPIPFTESKYCRYDEPDFWKDIKMPHPFKGYLKFSIEDKFMTLDDVEKNHSFIYKNIIEDFYNKYLKVNKQSCL